MSNQSKTKVPYNKHPWLTEQKLGQGVPFLQVEEPVDQLGLEIKQKVAETIEEEMRLQKLTMSEMAKKLQTSRSALSRLLDPTNNSVTLKTLIRTVRLLDKNIHFSIS